MKIKLKRVTESEIDFACRIESDVELWKYSNNVETDYQKLKTKFSERMQSDTAYDFVIQLNNEAETPVGLAYIWSYSHDEKRRSWEIGYAILPEHQKQGFCIDAVRCLLRFAFTELNAHKVIATCNEYNIASYRIMERLGMTREGVFREEKLWQGKWVDQYFYGILEDEYKDNTTV